MTLSNDYDACEACSIMILSGTRDAVTLSDAHDAMTHMTLSDAVTHVTYTTHNMTQIYFDH